MKFLRFAACAAMFSLAPVVAGAQGTAEQQQACTGDAFQFCGEFIPDAQRIEVCLRRNISRISPACRAQFRPGAASTARQAPLPDRHRPY